MTTTRIVRRTSAFGAFFAILALIIPEVLSVFADGGTYDVQVADKTGYAAQADHR